MNYQIEYVEEKKMIGFLLAYYRKYNIDKSIYSLKEFLKNDVKGCSKCVFNEECFPKEKICTPATLYKIEKGIALKNECYYYQFAYKFGKQVLFDDWIFKRLDQYRECLKKCMISNSKKEINQLLALITKDLFKYKKNIYISERLMLYHDLLNIQSEGKRVSEKNMDLYLYLKTKDINKDDKKLIILLMYYSNFSYSKYLLKSEDYDFDLNEENNILFPIQLYKLTSKINLDSYLELEKIKMDHLSSYYKYLVNDRKAFILMNLNNSDKAYTLMLTNYEYIETNDFTDKTKIGCIRKIGILSYSLAKYKDTYTYLMKAFKFSTNSLGNNYLLLFHSLEKLNDIEHIIQILNEIDYKAIIDKTTKTIIKYYSHKYLNGALDKKKICELEDIICEEMKDFSIFGNFYYNIIFSDLKNYVSKTSNYKKIIIFEKN